MNDMLTKILKQQIIIVNNRQCNELTGRPSNRLLQNRAIAPKKELLCDINTAKKASEKGGGTERQDKINWDERSDSITYIKINWTVQGQ